MEITAEQFALLEPYLPKQRGNVSHENLAVINAILYLAEHDCKWFTLPKRFGNWHSIYTRVNRWAKTGVLDRVFEQMQHLELIRIRIEVTVVAGATLKSNHEGARSNRRVAKGKPMVALASEPPKFTWVPRVRVCRRARAVLREIQRQGVSNNKRTATNYLLSQQRAA